MSRIGKLPIALPAGVKIDVNGQVIEVAGALGELKASFEKEVSIVLDGSAVVVRPLSGTARSRAMWGLARSIIHNMVKGVSQGFTVRLEINGVGYRSAVDGKILTLFLGYSHEIKYAIPAGVDIKCEKPTLLVISGADKQKVGQVAAEIRALRPPEPYKGKGIKYENEKIRRKQGKKK